MQESDQFSLEALPLSAMFLVFVNFILFYFACMQAVQTFQDATNHFFLLLDCMTKLHLNNCG